MLQQATSIDNVSGIYTLRSKNSQRYSPYELSPLRAFATVWGPAVGKLTETERRVAQLPEHLKPAAVTAKYDVG